MDARVSNEQTLSELRQQANVLDSLLRDDKPKASEFLITRIQSDLAYFETMVTQKDATLRKPKLCDLLTTKVSATVDSYSREEPAESLIAQEHLRNLLKWCAAHWVLQRDCVGVPRSLFGSS
jgi:hypothetical protein